MTLKDEAIGDNFHEPLSNDDTSTPSFPAYKNPSLKGTHAGTPFRSPKLRAQSAMLASAIAKARRPGGHRLG